MQSSHYNYFLLNYLIKKLISPQDKENRYLAAGTLYGAKTSLLYYHSGRAKYGRKRTKNGQEQTKIIFLLVADP